MEKLNNRLVECNTKEISCVIPRSKRDPSANHGGDVCKYVDSTTLLCIQRNSTLIFDSAQSYFKYVQHFDCLC